MRISEIYASMQGEGPRVGMPTIFLRFAGCNLKCPGWPCDTQHAIDPKLYRHEWKELGAEQILDNVMTSSWASGAKNVCFTGGEPFLQTHDGLRHLARLLHREGMSLEVFTNGTLEWPDWALYTFKFVMDWKLTGSGEVINALDIIMKNASRLTIKDAIKFTIASEADFKEAYNAWSVWFQGNKLNLPEFYCGPVWGAMSPSRVAQLILDSKLPWRLNIQAHKYIFGDERGI